MRAKQAYYRPMRYWTLVSTVSLAALFAVSASAQVNGVPPSVTSNGFGGHPGFNGPPPSVTSLGPNGLSHGPSGPSGIHQPPAGPGRPGSGSGQHQHHRDRGTYVYPYYVPYYPVVDVSNYDQPPDAQSAGAEDPEQYQGGPTIFDRRGSGARYADDYVSERPQVRVPRPDPPPAVDDDAEAVPDPPVAAPVPREPNTILVFKDGHKVEVGNYAIVGSNLFDLTPGRRQKVALADLDVPATEKINDDQGVDFKLPATPNSN